MAEKTTRTKKAHAGGRQEGPKTAATQPPAEKGFFPVVAVGASAGGLEAFEQFFRNMPPTTGAGFIVISHLDPRHESMMTELISRFTNLPVREAEDGIEVRPDHVYVIPPNRYLSIFHGYLARECP